MMTSASFCFSQTAFVNHSQEAWLPQLFVLIGRKPVGTGELKQGPSSKRRPRPRHQGRELVDTRRRRADTRPGVAGAGGVCLPGTGSGCCSSSVLYLHLETEARAHSCPAEGRRDLFANHGTYIFQRSLFTGRAHRSSETWKQSQQEGVSAHWSGQEGGRWPGCCQLNLHCCKDLGQRFSKIYKNFTYIHPMASDSF